MRIVEIKVQFVCFPKIVVKAKHVSMVLVEGESAPAASRGVWRARPLAHAIDMSSGLHIQQARVSAHMRAYFVQCLLLFGGMPVDAASGVELAYARAACTRLWFECMHLICFVHTPCPCPGAPRFARHSPSGIDLRCALDVCSHMAAAMQSAR